MTVTERLEQLAASRGMTLPQLAYVVAIVAEASGRPVQEIADLAVSGKW